MNYPSHDMKMNEAGSAFIPAGDVKTVYLIRHGQSEWNRIKRMTGQLDPGLSERGRLQSQALAEVLRGVPLAAIYSSTLRRTVETATPTAEDHGLPIVQDPGLQEMNLGILQGKFHSELEPEEQNVWETYKRHQPSFRIPGGESIDDLARRIRSCVWRILSHYRSGETLLIVGHRNVNRILLSELMEWPDSGWFDLDIKSQFLYRIDMEPPRKVQTIRLPEQSVVPGRIRNAEGRSTEGS